MQLTNQTNGNTITALYNDSSDEFFFKFKKKRHMKGVLFKCA